MNRGKWLVAASCFGLSALGCSGSREVEVTGKVTGASSSSLGENVVLEFRDVLGDGAGSEKLLVLTTSLPASREFSETLALEGDQLEISALDDRNRDGLCSSGEAWGRTSAPIERDKATGVTLLLQPGCPSRNE